MIEAEICQIAKLILGRFNAYEILISPSIKNKTTGSLNARKLFRFKKGQEIRG